MCFIFSNKLLSIFKSLIIDTALININMLFMPVKLIYDQSEIHSVPFWYLLKLIIKYIWLLHFTAVFWLSNKQTELLIGFGAIIKTEFLDRPQFCCLGSQLLASPRGCPSWLLTFFGRTWRGQWCPLWLPSWVISIRPPGRNVPQRSLAWAVVDFTDPAGTAFPRTTCQSFTGFPTAALASSYDRSSYDTPVCRLILDLLLASWVGHAPILCVWSPSFRLKDVLWAVSAQWQRLTEQVMLLFKVWSLPRDWAPLLLLRYFLVFPFAGCED